MRKQVKDGYILAVSCESGLTAEEEAQIRNALANPPAYQDGFKRMLRDDTKTWDVIAVPASDEPNVYAKDRLEQMTNAELEQILYSFGITANMNKANMIRLILAAQEGGAV